MIVVPYSSTELGPEEAVMRRSDEVRYQVLSPEGRARTTRTVAPPAVRDLDSAVVGQIWDYMFRGDEIFAQVRRVLTERHPGIRFVDHREFGDIHGPDQDRLTAEIPEKLRKHGCTAVIVGVGA
jgi:hypothetical protein